jgi:hypothetical protein
MPEIPCLVSCRGGARIMAEAMGEIAMRNGIIVVEGLPKEPK